MATPRKGTPKSRKYRVSDALNSVTRFLDVDLAQSISRGGVLEPNIAWAPVTRAYDDIRNHRHTFSRRLWILLSATFDELTANLNSVADFYRTLPSARSRPDANEDDLLREANARLHKARVDFDKRVSNINEIVQSEQRRGGNANWDRIVAITTGIVFLATLIVIALSVKNPTPFQEFVFRTILAIAAAAFGSTIPGLLEVELTFATGIAIRAAGALALFATIFLVNPPRLFSEPRPSEAAPVSGDNSEVVKLTSIVAQCDKNDVTSCRQACDAGFASSCARAVALYSRGCDNQSWNACNGLGEMYERGTGGLRKDLARATELYKKACDFFDAGGCFNLQRATRN